MDVNLLNGSQQHLISFALGYLLDNLEHDENIQQKIIMLLPKQHSYTLDRMKAFIEQTEKSFIKC